MGKFIGFNFREYIGHGALVTRDRAEMKADLVDCGAVGVASVERMNDSVPKSKRLARGLCRAAPPCARAGIGHNAGPATGRRLTGCLFSGAKPCAGPGGGSPVEVVRRRIALAAEAGITYHEYTLEILERGRWLEAGEGCGADCGDKGQRAKLSLLSPRLLPWPWPRRNRGFRAPARHPRSGRWLARQSPAPRRR